ncbi:hypothetical protein OAJ40_01695 [Candidatus Pelagibacter sp.]|nr:hypothetical protein [Candidatus Pelagibacter sp.]
MKKLLGIVVLGLLLSGNAYSKIIDLHCKFIAGNIVEKVPHPGHEDIKKNTTYISISEHDVEGYNIKLDTTNNKIIEAPMFESDGSTRMFGDDLIFWYASLSSGARLEIKFTLNRYTGRLREYHKHYKYGDTENNYWVDLIYDCSIAKKLF